MVQAFEMEQTLQTAKALSDSSRLRVLAMLMEHDELCVCQVTALLNLSTATVSKHMSILHGAHLVDSRKEGRWVYYRLSDSFPHSLHQWVTESLSQSTVARNDRKALQDIVACDRVELCRCQRPAARQAGAHGTRDV